MNQIFKTTIKALIIKNGKVFFVQDNAGLWELPGGKQEEGEKPEETLKRELKEELDVDEVEVKEKILSGNFIVEHPEWGKEYHFTAEIYKVDAKIENAKLSDEHTEMRWFILSELDSIRTRNIYLEAVRKFLNS